MPGLKAENTERPDAASSSAFPPLSTFRFPLSAFRFLERSFPAPLPPDPTFRPGGNDLE
jgi:hypothetical protein